MSVVLFFSQNECSYKLLNKMYFLYAYFICIATYILCAKLDRVFAWKEINSLPPHGLPFPISSKGSFICIIPQRGQYTPWSFDTPEESQWVNHEGSIRRPITPYQTLIPLSYISLLKITVEGTHTISCLLVVITSCLYRNYKHAYPDINFILLGPSVLDNRLLVMERVSQCPANNHRQPL